jgi:hypothetical protein
MSKRQEVIYEELRRARDAALAHPPLGPADLRPEGCTYSLDSVDDVMCAFRAVCTHRVLLQHDQLLHETARFLGVESPSAEAMAALESHLEIAFERRVVAVDGIWHCSPTDTHLDYDNEELAGVLRTVMADSGQVEARDAARLLTKHFGFFEVDATLVSRVRNLLSRMA